MGQVAADPVPHRGPPADKVLAVAYQPAQLPPARGGLVGQRQIAGQVLALHPCRVDLVGLAPPRLGRQWHLQDVGQVELHSVSQQFLHASPPGGALLDPDHTTSPAYLPTCLVDNLVEGHGCGQNLGEHLLAAGAAVKFADDAGTVVIIHGQDDILGHGGLR